MRGLSFVVFASGCGFHIGAATSGEPDAQHIDPDAREPDAPDAPDICTTWHPQHVMPCMLGTPKPPLVITAAASPWTYSTTTSGGTLRDNAGVVLMSAVTATQSDSSLVAVLNVEGLVVEQGATLIVVGEKPLVIASWGTINVSGTIDAGSVTAELEPATHTDGTLRLGAGGNPPGRCAGMNGMGGAPAIATGGSGGGGGGAHRGSGGAGTTGDSTPQPGGPGGMKLTPAPVVVRGGCAGGPSGNAGTSTGLVAPATSASFSAGGAGGGAVELVARTSILVAGTINAGGGAGAGAPSGSAVGGGGGGAGGYLGLDAPAVTVSGTLAANGGGGGGSAPYGGSANPFQGTQGQNAVGAAQAMGGPPYGGGNCGLAGAAGSVGATLDGPPATGADACGGGGGGGGAGFILVWSPTFMKSGSTITPAEQLQ